MNHSEVIQAAIPSFMLTTTIEDLIRFVKSEDLPQGYSFVCEVAVTHYRLENESDWSEVQNYRLHVWSKKHCRDFSSTGTYADVIEAFRNWLKENGDKRLIKNPDFGTCEL